jgi:hypothetical protein
MPGRATLVVGGIIIIPGRIPWYVMPPGAPLAGMAAPSTMPAMPRLIPTPNDAMPSISAASMYSSASASDGPPGSAMRMPYCTPRCKRRWFTTTQPVGWSTMGAAVTSTSIPCGTSSGATCAATAAASAAPAARSIACTLHRITHEKTDAQMNSIEMAGMANMPGNGPAPLVLLPNPADMDTGMAIAAPRNTRKATPCIAVVRRSSRDCGLNWTPAARPAAVTATNASDHAEGRTPCGAAMGGG